LQKGPVVVSIVVLFLCRVDANHSVNVQAGMGQHPGIQNVPLKNPRPWTFLKTNIKLPERFPHVIYCSIGRLDRMYGAVVDLLLDAIHGVAAVDAIIHDQHVL